MEDATQQCWQNGRPYFPLKLFQDMAKAQKLLHLVISVLSCLFETTWGQLCKVMFSSYIVVVYTICFFFFEYLLLTWRDNNLPGSLNDPWFVHYSVILKLLKMRVILVYNLKFVWTTMKKLLNNRGLTFKNQEIFCDFQKTIYKHNA